MNEYIYIYIHIQVGRVWRFGMKEKRIEGLGFRDFRGEGEGFGVPGAGTAVGDYMMIGLWGGIIVDGRRIRW